MHMGGAHMYMCAGARARVLLPHANSALPRARASASIASVLPCTASVLPRACCHCLNVVLRKAQAATQWPREQGHDVIDILHRVHRLAFPGLRNLNRHVVSALVQA
jgi:hypothetical protein